MANWHKLFFSIVAFFLLQFAQAQTKENIYLTGEYKDVPLSQFFEDVTAEYGIRFFYASEWVDDIKITASFSSTPFDVALSKVLSQGNLSAIDYDNKTMLIINQKSGMIVTDEGKELELVVIGNDGANPRGAKVKFSGYIKDANNGEEILGARVYVEELKTGTVTDPYGYYSMQIPVGTYTISFSFVGLQEETRRVRINEEGVLNMDLFESPIELDGVTVYGEAEDANVTGTQMGKTKLSIATMKKMPAFLGEVDVVKSITLLPGVTSVGEGSSGFNVRGGSVDQNLILLDGAPIFNSSHLFGFFSVFNPDAVDEVEFFRGGIPADFGGRLSSVLNVKQRAGSKDKFTLNGGIGLVSGRLTVEGPIIKQKTSYLVALRSSYSNWLLRSLNDPSLNKSDAAFQDASIRIDHTINDRSSLYLSTYYSRDRFKFGSDTVYEWQTANAVLRYNYLIGKKLSSSFTLVNSNYRYDVSRDAVNDGFELDYQIDYKSAQLDFGLSAGFHNISFGGSTILYDFSPGNLDPTNPASEITAVSIQNEQNLETAFYINDEFKLSPDITLMAGLRYSLFHVLGERDVYGYIEGLPKRDFTLNDTTSYGSGETITSYSGLEPRFSMRYSLGLSSSIKASYNRMFQYIHLISNTTAITPLDIWKASDTHIRPQSGDQVSFGYFRNFKNNTYEASLEFYYKWIYDLVDYRDGANLLLNPTLETELLRGDGRSYGAELLVKKSKGKLTGWASYTYSRSWRQVNGLLPEERINGGNWYPSNNDRPHDFKLVLDIKTYRRWSFAVNFNYSSGRPITAPEAGYALSTDFGFEGINIGEFPDITIANYAQRNQFRIPDYHRLDFSMTYEPNLKKDKRWKESWTFSIYNLYGRKNAYSIFFQDTASSRPQAYKLSVLGRPFPSITYNFTY